MIATLQCVVLDRSDALELAHFYQVLLGGVINQPDPRWSLDENWSTLHVGPASCSVSSGSRTTSRRDGRILPTRSNSTLTWESGISTKPRTKSSFTTDQRTPPAATSPHGDYAAADITVVRPGVEP